MGIVVIVWGVKCAFKLAKRSRSDRDFRRYRVISNTVCNLTRKDHRDHLEDITKDLIKNPRPFWRWLKNAMGGLYEEPTWYFVWSTCFAGVNSTKLLTNLNLSQRYFLYLHFTHGRHKLLFQFPHSSWVNTDRKYSPNASAFSCPEDITLPDRCKYRVHSLWLLKKALPSREETDISLSILNSKARFYTNALRVYY